MRDAGIVRGVKWPQPSRNKLLVDPLSDRGPAILLEARGIEHSIAQCRIVHLPLDDPRGYGLGRHLEANVRARGPIPLPVPHERAAGKDLATRDVVVPDDAHQPTEKGLAEPQSIERGTSKGSTTC